MLYMIVDLFLAGSIDDACAEFETENMRFIQKRSALHQCRVKEDEAWKKSQVDPAVKQLQAADKRQDNYMSCFHSIVNGYGSLPDDEALKAQALAAKQIFKDTMAVSVSSLEKFAACAYAHFVIYGLHLDERETAEPGAVDYGNVMHAFLEKFGKYLQENKIDYATMPKEEADKIAGEIAAELFRDETDLLTA